MRSRAARLTVVLALVAIAAAAAYQATVRARAVSDAAARMAAVNDAAARAGLALAELTAAERGYVAPGQGLDFWAGKVDEALASARAAMAELPQAGGAASRLDDFAVMDRRARDYVRDGQRSMASDLIFADGYEIAAAARAELASAASDARAALAAPVPRDRQIAAASLGVLAAVAIVAALLLLRGPKPAEPAVLSIAPEPVVLSRAADVSAVDDSIGAALDASLEGLTDAAPAAPFLAGTTASPASPPAPAIDLPSAAEVCVDLARLLDARDLQSVLTRMSDVLGARGLIVWMADAQQASLSPALTHGYAPALVTRLGVLSVEEDNATARAWRSKAPQIVDGALAVPLLTAEGCTGVLAAELDGGRERDGDVQSLARIMAAQLASSISAPAAAAGRAAEA